MSSRNLPRPEVLEKAIQALSARWQEARPEAVADLASGQVGRIRAAAATLRTSGRGILDTFLIDTLLATTDPEEVRVALRELGDATGALGLCAKAEELKSPARYPRRISPPCSPAPAP